MEESLKKVKRVVWRGYAGYFVVSLVMAIGVMGQVKEFERGETLIQLKSRLARHQ